jgi:hypothetical protein
MEFGRYWEQHYAAPLAAALEAEISALKQVSQLLRDQVDDMRPASATSPESAYTSLVMPRDWRLA